MSNYLVDRATLAKVVDTIVEQKHIANNGVDIQALREQKIQELDDKITQDILGALSRAQRDEFAKMIDSDIDSTEMFEKFFEECGVNLQDRISAVIVKFTQDFEGAQNE